MTFQERKELCKRGVPDIIIAHRWALDIIKSQKYTIGSMDYGYEPDKSVTVKIMNGKIYE